MTKLLAIKDVAYTGIIEYHHQYEIEGLIRQYTDKTEHVSHKLFKANQYKEAQEWLNSTIKKKKKSKKQKVDVVDNNIQEQKEPPKAPNEIEITEFHIGADCRSYLQWYYFLGGNEVPFGSFKGQIQEINNKNGILFKRLYVQFDEGLDVINGKEDHLWIKPPFDKPFLDEKVKVGDCVSFDACTYGYKRKDGTIDFSLKECDSIKLISNYDLPSDEELELKAAMRIVCETCLYTDHCDGLFCMMGNDYLEKRATELLNIVKVMNTNKEQN